MCEYMWIDPIELCVNWNVNSASFFEAQLETSASPFILFRDQSSLINIQEQGVLSILCKIIHCMLECLSPSTKLNVKN